jgi:hypothetical protein
MQTIVYIRSRLRISGLTLYTLEPDPDNAGGGKKRCAFVLLRRQKTFPPEGFLFKNRRLALTNRQFIGGVCQTNSGRRAETVCRTKKGALGPPSLERLLSSFGRG